jgi:hypothetical protein
VRRGRPTSCSPNRAASSVCARASRPEAVNKFWDNPETGGKVIDWVAGNKNTYDILEGFNWQLPPDSAHALARMDDPAQIGDTLRKLSGGELRDEAQPVRNVTPDYRDVLCC